MSLTEERELPNGVPRITVWPLHERLSRASGFRARHSTSGNMSAAFSPKQLSAFVSLLATAGVVQFNVSMVLLGLGSAFFFYLFLKSGYIPKVLSVYSLCTTPIFVGASFAFLFWPQYSGRLQLGWYPLALAEISIGLWLLIKGIRLRSPVSAE